MDDDRSLELLAEIRDLQRKHLAMYEEALRNQSESIEAQKGAIQYQRSMVRRVLLLLIPLIIIFLVLAGGTILGLAR